MPSVQELEKQLKEAKEAEERNRGTSMINDFKLILEGKYFKYKSLTRYHKTVGVVKYSDFKYVNNNIECLQHSAGVCVSKDYITGIIRNKESRLVSNVFDLTRDHIGEIDQRQFNLGWEMPKVIADARYALFLNIEWDTEGLPFIETKDDIEIDVPFVTLNSREISIVNGSPFMLPKNRHLATPAAREYVIARIRKEQEIESKCSHLYEECDRHYLKGKHKDWAELEKKINL